MAGSVNAWVTDDPEKDWPTVRVHLAHQLDTYNAHAVEGSGQSVPRAVDPDRIRSGSSVRLNYFWCEPPDIVAANIRGFTAGAPVETVFMFASLAGTSEDLTMRHVQNICTKLAPLLAEIDTGTDGGTAAGNPEPSSG
jgi:hypothetical protein